MSRVPRMISWLAVSAIVEWLIARTLTRSAIFMPKSPAVVMVYQALTAVGQVAYTLTGLLALGALAWLIWQAVQARRFFLSSSLTGILGLSLVSLVIPPAGAVQAAYHLLVLLVVALLARDVWRRPEGWSLRLARLIPASALFVGGVYQLVGELVTAARLPGLPILGGPLFNLGEALVVIAGFAYFWFARAGRLTRWMWGIAALPALAFSVMYLVNPAITGIIAIWSVGLTLYLPWPLYVISLWLAGVAILRLLHGGDPAGWAILLLAAGGYPPQLSSHVILGIVALSLLAGPATSVEGEPAVSDHTPATPVRVASI